MELIIGRFYAVPTVRGKIFHLLRDWPVLGPRHSDKEIIGFPHVHYHVDWRFVSKSVLHSVANFGRQTLFGIVVHRGAETDFLPAPVMRRRKCIRGFEALGTFPRAPWLRELESVYASRRLENLVCPHRGIPLVGCPREGNVVTCPGHGLRWNLTTGELHPTYGGTPQ